MTPRARTLATRRGGRRRRSGRAADAVPVWAACSVLLDYPTPELLDSLDDVAALVPDSAELLALVDHLRGHDLGGLQADYVATFDHTRKCALHLTYFAYGDTRRRGQALVRFKEVYRAAGVAWDESSGELPDHLCAVLQFGAEIDPDLAWGLLTDHRAGLEMLRLALASWRNDDGSVGSPWHGALAAVSATLPELRGAEADAVRRLVEAGPPEEAVGLDPYTAVPLIAPPTIPVGAPR